jgi:hypothetical protein
VKNQAKKQQKLKNGKDVSITKIIEEKPIK